MIHARQSTHTTLNQTLLKFWKVDIEIGCSYIDSFIFRCGELSFYVIVIQLIHEYFQEEVLQ